MGAPREEGSHSDSRKEGAGTRRVPQAGEEVMKMEILKPQERIHYQQDFISRSTEQGVRDPAPKCPGADSATE